MMAAVTEPEFVPPLAARPTIFDLMPNRSLVKYFVARGYRVYLIDWGEPGREQAHYGLGDYVNDLMPEALKRIRDANHLEHALVVDADGKPVAATAPAAAK